VRFLTNSSSLILIKLSIYKYLLLNIQYIYKKAFKFKIEHVNCCYSSWSSFFVNFINITAAKTIHDDQYIDGEEIESKASKLVRGKGLEYDLIGQTQSVNKAKEELGKLEKGFKWRFIAQLNLTYILLQML
jgi:hypothetical protein